MSGAEEVAKDLDRLQFQKGGVLQRNPYGS